LALARSCGGREDVAMRLSGGSHGYSCETSFENGRWVWVVKLNGTEVARGKSRWRLLAEYAAEEDARSDYVKAQRELKRKLKHQGKFWKPEL
jgi:hypothetical protein